MDLLKEKNCSVFNTEIKKGTLIWAKSEDWDVGIPGFISGITEEKITVMFHPDISNVVNHYIIPAEEVANKKWVIRWSDDMKIVNEIGEGDTDEAGRTDPEAPDMQHGTDRTAD